MSQTNSSTPASTEKSKLLDQVRNHCRVRHLALSTEKQYVQWIRRFILFHNKRHPLEMGKEEVSAFLTHLAVARLPSYNVTRIARHRGDHGKGLELWLSGVASDGRSTNYSPSSRSNCARREVKALLVRGAFGRRSILFRIGSACLSAT